MVKRKQKSTKKVTLQSDQDPSTPQSINKRNKPGRKRTQSEIQPLPSSVTNDSLNSKPTEVYTSTAVTNEELKEFIKESSWHGINNLELKMDGSEAASSDNHFKLEEVPTFYPTEEEFNNMGELIGALTLKAGRYGMCKVVPPANFKVNFGIEVEKYQFKTYTQKINYLGAKSREQLNFNEKLKTFNEQFGNLFRVPTVYTKTLNLLHLNNTVQGMGGFEAVVKSKKWAQIGRNLGYNPADCTSLSHSLKNIYENYVLPYNKYMNLADKIQAIKDKKRVRKNMGKKCELCLGGELKTDAMVQCETCQDYYHLGCFELKINVVFLPPFFCPVCLKNYEPSFGFDSGNGYYLNEFMTKANDFYQEYLIQKLRITDSQSNKRNNKVLPLNKEKEFWHHIDNPVVDLQVETANDLQSSYQGSGFTTAEINPHDPIATHPWNLNNIGNSPSNVLSNLQDKHSGMNVPWAYITMLFSTHCWHTDDHFAYSINYQHWGESKRYYSIPSYAAYEFEAFFKQLAPSLFKNDPELMYQLITMVSPQDIQKAGIPIYTCEQKAGEFVITLPQSYSCWYSNGFSFNESIYYAPYDWIPFGLKSKTDYQLQNRMPVFCFEELLLYLTNTKLTVSQANHLLPSLKEIAFQELEGRKQTKRIGPKEIFKEVSRDHRQVEIPQCAVCNTFCYLSHAYCTCEKNINKIVCLSHATTLCQCEGSVKCLVIHVTSAHLQNTIAKLERMSLPLMRWKERYLDLFKENDKIQYFELMNLIDSASSLQCVIPESINLKHMLDKYQEWVNKSSAILRGMNQAGNKNQSEFEYEWEYFNYVKELANEALSFKIASTEIDGFLHFYEALANYTDQLNQLLSQKEVDYTKILSVKKISQKYNFNMGNDKVKQLLIKWEWNQRAIALLETYYPLNDLVLLCNLASEFQIPKDNKMLIKLLNKIDESLDWQYKVELLLSHNKPSLKAIIELKEEACNVYFEDSVMRKLIGLKDKLEKEDRSKVEMDAHEPIDVETYEPAEVQYYRPIKEKDHRSDEVQLCDTIKSIYDPVKLTYDPVKLTYDPVKPTYVPAHVETRKLDNLQVYDPTRLEKYKSDLPNNFYSINSQKAHPVYSHSNNITHSLVEESAIYNQHRVNTERQLPFNLASPRNNQKRDRLTVSNNEPHNVSTITLSSEHNESLPNLNSEQPNENLSILNNEQDERSPSVYSTDKLNPFSSSFIGTKPKIKFVNYHLDEAKKLKGERVKQQTNVEETESIFEASPLPIANNAHVPLLPGGFRGESDISIPDIGLRRKLSSTNLNIIESNATNSSQARVKEWYDQSLRLLITPKGRHAPFSTKLTQMKKKVEKGHNLKYSQGACFCFHHAKESNLLCQVCGVNYHSNCIKGFETDTDYCICPVCDASIKGNIRPKRPTLATFIEVIDAATDIQEAQQLEEFTLMEDIVSLLLKFRHDIYTEILATGVNKVGVKRLKDLLRIVQSLDISLPDVITALYLLIHTKVDERAYINIVKHKLGSRLRDDYLVFSIEEEKIPKYPKYRIKKFNTESKENKVDSNPFSLTNLLGREPTPPSSKDISNQNVGSEVGSAIHVKPREPYFDK